MMEKKNIKKLLVVGLASLGVFISGVVAGQASKPQDIQSSHTKVASLKPGTTYKRGNLSIVLTTYKCKGHENYVVNTTLKHKQYYDVGCNSKHGKTDGVTVAFGNDQR